MKNMFGNSLIFRPFRANVYKKIMAMGCAHRYDIIALSGLSRCTFEELIL